MSYVQIHFFSLGDILCIYNSLGVKIILITEPKFLKKSKLKLLEN
jgi:hypothetical protein